ncbi:PIG-L deacetylase family protein [Flagellimonas marinaquae]
MDRFAGANKPYLIVAPHPDDEIIGLGGLLQFLLEQGQPVHILYLTDGEASASYPDRERIREERIKLAEGVLNTLGISDERVWRLQLQDGHVPKNSEKAFTEAVHHIEDIIHKVNPSAIFVTHHTEYWPFDHVAAFELLRHALVSIHPRPELWLYWVWTWFHLRPWCLPKDNALQKLDISRYLKRKRDLMADYLLPCSPIGIPWSGQLPQSMLEPHQKAFELIEKYEF